MAAALEYALNVKVMEQELKMEMTRTVEPATFEGMDVWRITDAVWMVDRRRQGR